MSKNLEMLRTFKKVMLNNKEEIEKVIPNMYCKNFYDIDTLFLLSSGIKKVIVDIDGTMLPADSIDVGNVLLEKVLGIKAKNIDICLVSNNDLKRVLPVAEKLKVDKYLANANKPLPECFDTAMALFNTTNKEEVAMIGDQMLSDIKGANEYGLYTILVRPISKHQNIQTGTSRVLQNIMEHHLKKIKKFDKKVYYKNR